MKLKTVQVTVTFNKDTGKIAEVLVQEPNDNSPRKVERNKGTNFYPDYFIVARDQTTNIRPWFITITEDQP